ncbi:oligosaccharide flippase family protein [Mesorhizobium sp. KR1-2]|uniref:oligosaccharide flippase family protein n=1 Tax=Mesorhizobium sp. KR1-2 TaxID=3156609 RepID=UPI0032B5977D
MKAVRQSIAFSTIDKYLSQILLITTTAVMARILTPAETGLYMTANAVILLADNFRSFGVGIYIVQEKQLSRAMVQSAFTIMLTLSVVAGAAIYLGAGSIASFYASPDLKALLLVAALGFFTIPFSSPIMALLQREMAFRAVACINVAAALVAFVITITLGLAGLGPVSYVWGSLGASLVTVVLALVARPKFWIFRLSFARIGPLLSFGVVSSLITVSNMAYELLPRLAFGKFLGLDAVGLYSRAVTICQLPDRVVISALHPVILPAFAAQARAGDSLKKGYLHGLSLMTAVQWPALIMLSLLADPVVSILLGQQWGGVPPLVRIMALANMALAPAVLTFPVLVSAGRIKDALWSSVISLPPSFLIIIGAAFIGLDAVAASLLVVAPLQMFVVYPFIRRAIDLQWTELLRAARHSALLALGTALVPILVILGSPTGFDFDWIRTIVALVGGAAGWLATLVLVDHPVKSEVIEIWSFLSEKASISATARRVTSKTDSESSCGKAVRRASA